MIRPIPIGVDDFRDLREKNHEYIDKTHLITEFLDRENIKVVLLPRPRRFGKSLNMSTLKWFFEKRDENVWHLFEGLHVAQAGEKYRAHFQKYPVIHISLKETKADDFQTCMVEAKRLISDMYAPHKRFLDGKLNARDQADFEAIWLGTADDALYRRSIKNLTMYLHLVHGVRPIVLIDEYDAGIHASHANGFYKEAIGFFGGFFLAGLKDNVHLERAVMTGILRVSRESIFSDLNNIGVYSLLRTEFSTCLGFTEQEVEALLEKANLLALLASVRAYYNGYEFGRSAIYNPWSILSLLANVEHEVIPYWVETSSNTLIKELLQHHAFKVQEDIQTLLEGGYIEKELDTNVVIPELKSDPRSVWNLLVFSGYLKASRPDLPRGTEGRPAYRLSIPNREVAEVYQSTFQSWMQQGLGANGGDIDTLLAKLLDGDAQRFARALLRRRG